MTAPPRTYAFQHAGLDRAEHLREDAERLRAHWTGARLLVVDDDGNALFAGAEDAPEFAPHVAAEAPPAGASFLGLDEAGAAWFALPAAALQEHAPLAPPPLRLDLRSAAMRWPALPAAVRATGSADRR